MARNSLPILSPHFVMAATTKSRSFSVSLSIFALPASPRAGRFLIPLVFFLTLFFRPAFANSREGLAAASSDSEIYETVPNGKSLLTSPRFILIDDFNTGKFLNRRKATWQAKGPG